MVLWKTMRNINLALPAELLDEIDEAAKIRYMSRSEYIREILRVEIAAKQTIDPLRPIKTEWLDVDDS